MTAIVVLWQNAAKKFPMPEHEQWECFGPVATADQIKYTREEDTVSESMMFREECDFCSLMGQTRNVIGAAPIRWLILVMAPVIFCRPLMISHSGRPLRSKHSRSRYSLCDGGCRRKHALLILFQRRLAAMDGRAT